MDSFNHLPDLPGTAQEQAWLRERLETLSVQEETVLSASLARQPPESAADAINHIQALDSYEFCFPAGNHEQLGQFQLRQEDRIPEEALPYVDFEQLGRQYEEAHPGQFIGNCYVVYPSAEPWLSYSGQNAPLPKDGDWSVKLRLASPAVPEGAWLRLPDYTGGPSPDSGSMETMLVLERLRARDLSECTLLDARCVLPEIDSLTKEYDRIADLIWDGNNLGFILDEQGQGAPLWMERFAAALELEACHSLRFALDISQNLQCYEYIPVGELEALAERQLRAEGVSKAIIDSGCIALHDYAEDFLETSGYMLTSGENGYIIRNTQKFVREFSIPEEPPRLEDSGENPALRDIPLLASISHHAAQEEVDAAMRSISASLAGRGPEGLRQFQAAIEYEDCANLESAAEIAEQLDRYVFLDIGSFQEEAKQELVSLGLDKRVVELCFNFETYAAITHDYEDIYSSRTTGLFVHKSDTMSQPSQGGMTMQ